MIRVIHVDDHAVVRRGVRQLLSEAGDITLVGEANDGVELMKMLQAQSCDVVLLDISMPGRDGLSILRDIRNRHPGVAVLMLSMFPGNLYAIRALRAGAAGYVPKDTSPEELIKAIRKVASRARYVPPDLGEFLAASFLDENEKSLHEALSEREFAVLCRIGAGKAVSQIADELFLSINTVSTYRARILAKLKLTTTAELMHYVVSHRLNG